MKISVIIVNYNVRQYLENALTSIRRALEGIEGEIFVVDNASDDGSVAMVRSSFPDVCVLANPENIGFARANNLALEKARGEFLLLINPDTIVQEDTLREMLHFFQEHPDAGLAGCKILNPDGTFQLPCRRSFPTPWVAFTKIFGLSALFPSSRIFGRYNLTYLSPDETYQVDAVSGSFMMLRRAAYECVGGLDESFFMYGEDLDWCFRVRQAGFGVYYVHSTQIIHFKGESTRRSNINEVEVFYGAMELFVEKHFSRSRSGVLFLRAGILLRATAAAVGRMVQPLLPAFLDVFLVAVALLFTEFLYFGLVFRFPRYAYPLVWTIPGLLVALVGAFLGIYTTHRLKAARAGLAVLIGYVLISATVFFAKTFAFSRAVVVISGLVALILLPGWRLLLRSLPRRLFPREPRRSLFGSRTLIVGTGVSGQEVLRRLRARVDDGYDVQGFIDTSSAHIGERVAGIEIVGSLENVGKVIGERRITDVIFSTDELPYTAILAVISRSNNRNVNFRLVPTSLEAIIGKTRIDDLETLPLVEIEYNIHKPSHRFMKRLFDVVGGLVLLLTVYPVLVLLRVFGAVRFPGRIARALLAVPRILSGQMSFVGLPEEPAHDSGTPGGIKPLERVGPYLGPRGITGLAQINAREGLSHAEIERYQLYYAKNHSLLLDVEILLKATLHALRR